MSDLHVYSTSCSWHGPISKVGKTAPLPETEVDVGGKKIRVGGPGSGLPCCPYCGSMLFQMGENEWWDGVTKHADEGHSHYEEFLRWTMTQERCWPSLRVAAESFHNVSGKRVKFDL